MKKYKSPLLQFQSYMPSEGEQRARALRIRKDRQLFNWLMETVTGRGLIELSRAKLGLPAKGISPTSESFMRLEDIGNYPPFTNQFNPKTLSFAVSQILKNRHLSSRFWNSVEALIIFGKPLVELPPAVSSSVIIRDFKKPKKELWLRIYPDATFKDDIRAYWRSTVILQQQLETEKHAHRWTIHPQKVSTPVEETAVYVRVYKDTTLEDLNSSKFKKELSNAFKKAGLSNRPFRKWDYKKARELLDLDMGKDSDWDKAEKLFGDEKRRNAVKKLRQRARRKI